MEEAQHAATSLKEFGKPFLEVHAFLDQYYTDFGPSHRRILHHKRGVDLVVEKFGEEAGAPAKLHVLEDIQMFVPDATDIPDDWRWYGKTFLLPEELYPDYKQ